MPNRPASPRRTDADDRAVAARRSGRAARAGRDDDDPGGRRAGRGAGRPVTFAELERRRGRPRRRARRERGAPGRPGRAARAAGHRPDRGGLRLLADRGRRSWSPTPGSACAASAGPCAAPVPSTSSASRRAARGRRRCGCPGRADPRRPGARARSRPLRAGDRDPRRARSPAGATASRSPRRREPDDEAAVLFTSGRDRAGQGRGLPPPPAAGPAATWSPTYAVGARRPAGRRLRAVRAVRSGPGLAAGGAGHGRHRARHPHRARPRRGGRRGRRDHVVFASPAALATWSPPRAT